MKNKQSKKEKKIGFTKATLKKLDRIHKKCEELFKEDQILLRKLRREINAQQRRAS